MASEYGVGVQSGGLILGVTIANLADGRGRARAIAQRAGLTDDRAAQFGVAVNEAVVNAIEHGGSTAIVTVSVEPDRVVAEVYDRGPGTAARLPVERPAPDQLRGRGLWLAQQFCDQLEIFSSADGSLTRLTVLTGDPADTHRTGSGGHMSVNHSGVGD
jgi:serine/threonine-protein kinase RsbW